jgi:general stress protein 26
MHEEFDLHKTINYFFSPFGRQFSLLNTKRKGMFHTKEEGEKKLTELVEDIKTCMFTTTDEDCNVFSRPMFTVKIDNECCLWYFANELSEKVKDLEQGKQATLVFSHPGKNSYMNIYGNCTLIHDKNKMKELWQPALRSFFPEGIDDPSVCLLKVNIDEAFYWDNSSNDMILLYKNESHKPYQTDAEEELFIPQTSHW